LEKGALWQAELMEHLRLHGEIGTAQAARLWNVSDRTARSRLQKLVKRGLLSEIGTGPKDPKRVYVPRGGILSNEGTT